MFDTSNGFWLYSNAANEFGVRDIGYYVGYSICKAYYEKVVNKKKAIEEIIRLNYNDEEEVKLIVDKSGYFSKPVQLLKDEYEAKRPEVTAIVPFKNRTRTVDSKLTQIILQFSKPMDTLRRNFEIGPLGIGNILKVDRVIGFSDNGKSLTIKINMIPEHHYQLVVGNGFRSADGISLKPFLVDFWTFEH